MGTPCNNVEIVFRSHKVWSKARVIEFWSDWWSESERAGYGIGFDLRIKARYARGFVNS